MARILLVEDNDLNRDMLSRRLEKMGYSIAVAVNGQDGVNQAKDCSPDLILMDINMPVMDGWEATRILKNTPQTRNIPIIAITAHAMTTDREKADNVGFNDYTTKPVDFPALVQTIETWLNQPL